MPSESGSTPIRRLVAAAHLRGSHLQPSALQGSSGSRASSAPQNSRPTWSRRTPSTLDRTGSSPWLKVAQFPNLTCGHAQLPRPAIPWGRDQFSIDRAAFFIVVRGSASLRFPEHATELDGHAFLVWPGTDPVTVSTASAATEMIYVSLPSEWLSGVDRPTEPISTVAEQPAAVLAPSCAFIAGLCRLSKDGAADVDVLRRAIEEVVRSMARTIAGYPRNCNRRPCSEGPRRSSSNALRLRISVRWPSPGAPYSRPEAQRVFREQGSRRGHDQKGSGFRSATAAGRSSVGEVRRTCTALGFRIAGFDVSGASRTRRTRLNCLLSPQAGTGRWLRQPSASPRRCLRIVIERRQRAARLCRLFSTPQSPLLSGISHRGARRTCVWTTKRRLP